MKLTTITTALKHNAIKMLAGAALAGAFLTAAAPAAQAQHVYFGVHFGGPRYYAPPPPVFYGYGHPGFYGPRYEYWRYHHIDRWGHRW